MENQTVPPILASGAGVNMDSQTRREGRWDMNKASKKNWTAETNMLMSLRIVSLLTWIQETAEKRRGKKGR